MDWLRIAAFGLLMVHHVAMVFGPWHWAINAAVRDDWLIVPLALMTPWRLPLLFCVSGFASRRLLDRTGSLRGFLRSRNLRLLIPWAFAMAMLLPPEMWVRARLHGYPHGLLRYWSVDYWSLSPVAGYAFPNWEHLWFVAYLWAYTVVLVGVLAAAGGDGAARMTRAADALARPRLVVGLPIAALVSVKLALLFVVPEGQGLLTDWSGHAEFLPVFLFGFALGGNTTLWRTIARSRHVAGPILAVAAAVLIAIELRYRGEQVPPHVVMAIDRTARLAFAWTAIVLLLGVADRLRRVDGRWRAALSEAVFPFYLVHHPAIVMLAWLLLPLGLPHPATFALLLAGTAAICTFVHVVGGRIAWLRPLIGLAAKRRPGTGGSGPPVGETPAGGALR